jgi:hypothetical protein
MLACNLLEGFQFPFPIDWQSRRAVTEMVTAWPKLESFDIRPLALQSAPLPSSDVVVLSSESLVTLAAGWPNLLYLEGILLEGEWTIPPVTKRFHKLKMFWFFPGYQIQEDKVEEIAHFMAAFTTATSTVVGGPSDPDDLPNKTFKAQWMLWMQVTERARELVAGGH